MKSGADFIENKQFKLCLRIANLTFFNILWIIVKLLCCLMLY
jgi:hypothetical protein